LGIFEILLFLIIALIVIPPDDLPQVMRAAGKVMRELRLASNTVMREISSAIGDEAPYNVLPPRFEDPQPPTPSASPQPAPRAFLAPETQASEPSPTEPQPVTAEPLLSTPLEPELKSEVQGADQPTPSPSTEQAQEQHSTELPGSGTPTAKP
jgi:Sec-independent protein translocase protein TatA